MDNTKSDDKRFGAVAIKNGFITMQQLKRALVLQERVLSASGIWINIGNVLIKMGHLAKEQIESILAAQQMVMDTPPNAPIDEAISLESTSIEKESSKFALKEFFEILISDDQMSAYLIPLDKNHSKITLEDLKEYINNNGIKYGIINDNLLEKYLGRPYKNSQKWEIALGAKAVRGEPAKIKYFFDTDPLKIGTILEDGTTDWKDKGEIPQVKSETLIAEKTPRTRGTPGTAVSGKPILPEPAQDMNFRGGKGVSFSEDRLKLFSKVGGTPKITEDGRINVLSILTIKGDIGLETGHIDFDGYIDVSGIVQTGYNVKGQCLRVKEIQDATIEMEGDIIAWNGVYLSDIKAKGDFKASHVHNSKLEINGNTIVEKEIFNSKIETGNKCMIGDGKIISSEIFSKNGIIAQDIGTVASKDSSLNVGVDNILKRKIIHMKENVAKLKTENKDLSAILPGLQKSSEKISIQLGEDAQKQDRLMVKERELQEQLEKVQKDNKKDEIKKIEIELNAVTQKKNEIDANVDKLLDSDEKITDKIKKAGLQKQQLDEEIEKNSAEIDVLVEALKNEKVLAMIKVHGHIFSGNTVKGRYSNIILEKDYSRVQIMETNKNDEGIATKWHMKISPLR